MTEATRETLTGILERYGFPTLVALAAGWMLRNDVLIPLTEEHRQLIRTVSETQREIAASVAEQTRLLYALQPRVAIEGKPDPTRN
jgi:hypothetical protein